MSLILLGAGKGAPGVTTAAVALAAVWPRRGVVAECDPSGADLVLRLVNQEGRPLAQDRGMLSLASAVGSSTADLALSDHVQTAAGGLDLLVGPPSPRHAAALEPLWPALGVHLAAGEDCDVLADCGRLTPPTVVLQLEAGARLLVLLARATPAGMAHLRPILTDVDQRGLSEKVVVLRAPAGPRASTPGRPGRTATTRPSAPRTSGRSPATGPAAAAKAATAADPPATAPSSTAPSAAASTLPVRPRPPQPSPIHRPGASPDPR